MVAPHPLPQRLVEHAFVQSVLIDDDEALLRLLHDIAVMDLEVPGSIDLLRGRWGRDAILARRGGIPRGSFRAKVEMLLHLRRAVLAEELRHGVGDVLSPRLLICTRRRRPRA